MGGLAIGRPFETLDGGNDRLSVGVELVTAIDTLQKDGLFQRRTDADRNKTIVELTESSLDRWRTVLAVRLEDRQDVRWWYRVPGHGKDDTDRTATRTRRHFGCRGRSWPVSRSGKAAVAPIRNAIHTVDVEDPFAETSDVEDAEAHRAQ